MKGGGKGTIKVRRLLQNQVLIQLNLVSKSRKIDFKVWPRNRKKYNKLILSLTSFCLSRPCFVCIPQIVINQFSSRGSYIKKKTTNFNFSIENREILPTRASLLPRETLGHPWLAKMTLFPRLWLAEMSMNNPAAGDGGDTLHQFIHVQLCPLKIFITCNPSWVHMNSVYIGGRWLALMCACVYFFLLVCQHVC